MNQKELKELIKLCRKEGVLTYKTPELEFTLSSEVKSKKQQKFLDDKIEQDKPPTEEDVLFWSSGVADA